MGGEASTAGAGMLAPGGELERDGELARMSLASLAAYPGFVEGLQEESGHRIDFRTSGALELARDEAEWVALCQKVAHQQRFGICGEPVAAPAHLTHWRGAMHYPADKTVDPRDVMRALREACERREVKIREGIRVSRVIERGRHVEVSTERRVWTTEQVVIAAGAWTSEIATHPSAAGPASEPVRGHLASFHMQPGLIGPILRNRQTYLLQRSNGELIAGTSQERVGFDRAIDEAAVVDICERASELVPELRGRRPDRAWIGFRPGLIEGEGPVIERVGNAIWRAYGHYRNGILLAPATAEIVAGKVLGSLATAS
jgi:glycine oxidase